MKSSLLITLGLVARINAHGIVTKVVVGGTTLASIYVSPLNSLAK